MISKLIYLSSLDLSDSDDEEDEDDEDELSCFRRGGFCIVECELFVVLLKKIYSNFRINFLVFFSLFEKEIELYFEIFVDDVFLLLPDESESRLTGTT